MGRRHGIDHRLRRRSYLAASLDGHLRRHRTVRRCDAALPGFPIYLIPFLEERFETKLPKESANAKNHVVIFDYGPAVATLITELKQTHIPAVIIDEDEDDARHLLEQGHNVIYGNLDHRQRLGARRAGHRPRQSRRKCRTHLRRRRRFRSVDQSSIGATARVAAAGQRIDRGRCRVTGHKSFQPRGLENQHPQQNDLRERTGCTIVALERGEELLVEFPADFKFTAGDAVYVCGSAEATQKFYQLFPQE